MKIWNISHGKDGFTLMLEDVPWWALAMDRGWMWGCDVTNGRLGGHDLGPWAWKVPVGRPKWDRSVPDEPWLENSLAGVLMDLENRVGNFAYRQATRYLFDPQYRVILTDGQARLIDPEFARTMTDVMREDDNDR